MKKILAFTTIRSDYDLMSPLFRLLHEDEGIEFKLLVAGAHLSKAYGHSVDQIKSDGFGILIKLETLINSDSRSSRIKTAALLMQNSIDVIAGYSPDIILYAGDREDVIVAALIAAYLGIPSIHFYSGEHVKDGYIDNPVRHAASKLATAHFVMLEEHRRRLIRMGEASERIFVVGNISLDRLAGFSLKTRKEISDFFHLDFIMKNFALVIFHPVTAEQDNAGQYLENILECLKYKKILAFVSYPNVDPGNYSLIKIIEKYMSNKDFVFYKNLDRDIFLSIYRESLFIIGNSSSGICEAASFRIPAINVGVRQTGRRADSNVIFCGTDTNSISSAIDTAVSPAFLDGLIGLKNSYGDGNSALKAYTYIKTIDFQSMLDKTEDPLDMEPL